MSNYSTREMLEALDQTMPVRSYLSRTFFPKSNLHISETIEIDVRKSKRKMAPFVAPRKGGKLMVREGFRTNLIKTPKIAPERITTTDDIIKRGIGEKTYTKKTPKQREKDLLAKDINELQEAIERRKEWEAREVILSGKFSVIDEEEGLDVQVDYGFTNKEILSGTLLWSNEEADPVAQLKARRELIIQKTGKAPDIVLLAPDVVADFMANAKVKAAMNIINISNIVLEPKSIDPAVTYIGRISELALKIYSYDEWFVDDDNEEQPMLPSGIVIIGHSTGIGSFEYGSVTQLEKGKFMTYEAEVVPKMWVDEENEIKKLRLTSRPVPRPDDVDSWYVLDVL